MKIRIQDNSVRFRITLKELDELNANGSIEGRSTSILSSAAAGGTLVYGVRAVPSATASECQVTSAGIWLELCPSDLATLNDAAQEGVYLRREHNGERFMAFIEKDRPGGKCDKPEAWVYEYAPGQAPSTKPIG